MIEAFSSFLKRAGGFTIVGTGTTTFDVVEISRRTHPQIAVVDLSMPGGVYGAIASAIKISPSTKIVAFSAATGVDLAVRALDAGASGCLLKGSPTSELIEAILKVQSGRLTSPRVFPAALSRDAGMCLLGGKLPLPPDSVSGKVKSSGSYCGVLPTKRSPLR